MNVQVIKELKGIIKKLEEEKLDGVEKINPKLNHASYFNDFNMSDEDD